MDAQNIDISIAPRQNGSIQSSMAENIREKSLILERNTDDFENSIHMIDYTKK